MSAWWLDPEADWSSGDPARLVQLLAAAYPTHSQAKCIIHQVGLALDGTPSDAVTGEMLWLGVMSVAARDAKTLDLAAAVLADTGASAFHAPLLRLLGPQLANVVYRHGLPKEGVREVLEALEETSSEPTDQPLEGLQAIRSPASGLHSMQALLQTIHAAQRRVAMIERNGQAVGTGMLVGDDLLLTAGHVLGGTPWPPQDLDGYNARFDYYEQGRVATETGVRVPIEELLAESPPTEPESAQGAEANWNASSSALDYALLRLEHPVDGATSTPHGQAPRGFYALTSEPYDFAHADLLFIAQHPLGQYQAYSHSGAPQINENRTRIRYTGNTLAGSSGSPVIDKLGRLVAVHHYSTRTENQAVTTSSIHDAIVERLGDGILHPQTADAQPGAGVALPPDPYVVKVLGGKPFVNRATLRQEIRGMAQPNGQRTLVIDGQTESGVSTSYQLMAHVAASSRSQPPMIASAPGGLKVIPIDLRKYRDVAVAKQQASIIEHLCMHFPGELGSGDAQPAREVETFKHWWMNQLQQSDQQHWIFIDSVDSATEVVQSGLDELIRALAELANDPQNPLRVVLAGREASMVAENQLDFPARDWAAGLSRNDVDQWVRERADDEGRTVFEDELTKRLDELFPSGASNPRLRLLALKLPALFLEVTG